MQASSIRVCGGKFAALSRRPPVLPHGSISYATVHARSCQPIVASSKPTSTNDDGDRWYRRFFRRYKFNSAAARLRDGAVAAGAAWLALNSSSDVHSTLSRYRANSAADGDGNDLTLSKEKTATSVTKDSSASSGESNVSDSENGARGLKFVSGAACLPHPDKVAKGGEDAYFIASNGHVIGVADGVGGWGDRGIDPGLYSKTLMSEAKAEALKLAMFDDRAPQQILEAAFVRTKETGSTTACIVCLGNGKLHAANLGDSGFMVVREGKIVFMSPPQQHKFNFPYQIGTAPSDPPSAAQRFQVEVKPGDIVVAGTDGWLDNVFGSETAILVHRAKLRGYSPARCADVLARFARERATDRMAITPFAQGAKENGIFWQGGKMDDITVVVSFIVNESKL